MTHHPLSSLAARELSSMARLGHLALLLLALSMCTAVGSLWLTEPALPNRTVVAFAALFAANLGWSAYAAWVLKSRRTLLVFQQVVAARIAVSFCLVALAGTLAVAIANGHAGAWVAAAVFTGMLAAAALMLLRAQRRVRQLQARRAEIERQLGQ